MPDFFINNSRVQFNQNEDAVKNMNQNSKSYWDEQNARMQQKNAEYVEDLQRYSVNIPQEQYNIIKDAIANAEVPEDEAYRWAAAMELNNQYNIPIQSAYQNLESINAALWGDQYEFTPKTSFKAIVDNGRIGANTLKMGEIGNKIMLAESKLNGGAMFYGEQELQELYDKYAKLEQENASLSDKQARPFVIEALKFGAQSVPFTGAVIGASALGTLLAPGVGTAAGFATSMANASGLQYIKLREAGSEQSAALGFSLVSGGLQALVEVSLGNVAGALGRTTLGDMAGEAVSNTITGNLFKRLTYDGTFKTLALRLGKEYVKENFEEGLEEVIQDLIEKGTDALAAEYGNYEIDSLTAKQVARDAWENFRGGLMGSLVLGLPTSAIKVNADVKEFTKVRSLSEQVESQELFNVLTDDNPIFRDMTTQEKREAQKTTWENGQARKEARATEDAKQIAEGLDAGEGAEERKVTYDENGNEIEEEPAESVARDEKGRLFVQDQEYKDDNGKVTGGQFWAGNAEQSGKEAGNRYGYITYSQDENGDITIDTFKMTKGREGLREELFDQFAQEHPDVKIEWNAIGSDTQAIKQQLIDANPSGVKNGLSYYTTEELNNPDRVTRRMVAAEVRKNIHNVVKNADGSYTRTDLNNKQVAAAVTLIESAAKRMNMSLSDYVSKTFGNQIFGTREQFAQSALAQGDTISDKAGGMNQGVAQANWKQVGQQVKAVIYAGENADFSTWAHEMAHVFQNQLDGDLKTEAENAFNVQDGNWINSQYTFSDGRTMSSAEAFAYGFQDWLETGKAENQQMQNIFQKFAQFIADAYNKLKKHLNFTPEIESVFNKLLDGDDTIMSKALKAAKEEENEYRANLKRQAEEAENAKKAEAEETEKQAELEKEEAGEYTEYAEQEQSAEEIENQLEESNEKETGNAIDDALENTNFTSEQKAKVSEVLNDETTTTPEKADAIVDAAGEQFDLFQKQEGLLYQLAGEPSIRRMAESEEKRRILAELDAANELEKTKYKDHSAEGKALRIRMATGWERDANGQWKYELDDSVNRIKTEVFKKNPELLTEKSASTLLNLGDIYDAPELYKVFPYMKAVRVSFYSDPNAFRAVLTPQGIKVNLRYLEGVNGEKGLKGVLAHEIQHVIQAMEYAESTGLQGADIEQLYNDMMDAMQAAGDKKYDYDITSLQEGLDAYMKDAGEIEARNVARRILMNPDKRRNTTLASTEDVKRQLLFQASSIEEIFEKAPSYNSEIDDVQELKKSAYKYAKDTLQGQMIPNNTSGKDIEIEISSKGINEWYSKTKTLDQAASMMILDKLLKEAEYETTDENKHNPDDGEYDYYNAPTVINDKKYIAKFSIKSIIEGKGKKEKNRKIYHHHYLDDIEIEPVSSIVRVDETTTALLLTGPNKNITQAESEVNQKLDDEYRNAVESGDTEKAMQMLAEEAERKGYTSNSDYQGTSAFNGAAPYRNGYFDTKEKRLQAIKDEEFEDTETLGDFAYDNADALGFDYMINDPRAYRAADDKRKEAIDNLRSAIKEAKNGKKNVTIKMYRSVPADIKEGSFRNGDWITPSKSYAEDNADVHSWGPGEYRIIEQDVDLENIWWDGNDIAEWGYDDEKEAVYKNTENNRKLFEITYDENGDLIPLSKRFDENNPSILYQIAGEIGAQNLDDAETQEGVSRMQNLAIAKEMEAAGKDAQEIRLATGWEKGTDGYWKYEIDDGVFTRPQEGTRWETVDGKTIQVPKLQNEGFLREFYKNPELYKAYSDLENVWVSFKNYPEGQSGNTYTYNGNIHIDINANDSVEEQKKTLVHEIQHIIQHVEGFAKGGSMERAAKYIDEQNNIKKETQDKALAWSWKQELEEEEKKHPELRGQTYLMDALIDEYKEDGYDIDRLEKEGWIPSQDIRNRGFNLYVRGYDKEGFEDAYKEWSEGKLSDYKPKANNQMAQYFTYKRFGGEVESRNVESRMNFTPAQRLNTLIAATEDVAPEDKIILFQAAYHGSAANFDKFDTEQYGMSGEGSMAFGYGTYVTDDEEIARDYARRQAVEKYPETNRDLQAIANFMAGHNISFEEAKKIVLDQSIRFAEPYARSKIKETFAKYKESDLQSNGKRNLYTVEIPDDIYLDWNKPVTKEIIDRIAPVYAEEMYNRWLNDSESQDGFIVYNDIQKQGIRKSFEEELQHEFELDPTYDGAQLYNHIRRKLEYYDRQNGAKLASKLLNKAGFAGLKYPAGMNYTAKNTDAVNYVIFNDDDVKIVDHLLFQTNAELMQEAQGFDSWQEFMDYCETFHVGVDEVSPIPSEADAQWYQSFWETSHGLQTEQEKNEQEVQEKDARDNTTAKAMDALFTTYIRSYPEMLDDFLHEVARIDAIDLDSDEWRNIEDDMDAAERDKIDQLKDAIAITMSDYNWQSAMRRVQGGGEISEGMRKRLMGEMTDTMKSRDFRALYAEVMEDAQYAVDEEDTTASMLSKKLQKYQKRYYDIVKPGEDISKMSPEKRKRIAEAMANRDIANKIKNGSLKLDDELDAYIKSLDAQIKEKQKQFDELEKETKADYQRIADAEKRRLLKLHDELLVAKSKINQKNSDIARKVNKGLKITDKYKRESQNLQANYDELFRKFNDLKNTIQITAEVQAALDRQEQVANVREDLNAKQKEKNLTNEVKKMRINLVKRTMRRVPFNRIDYDNAKTVIAIQRMLEPNLIGGVNRFIGVDSAFLRGVISQVVTDSEYKEKLLNYLNKNSRASEAFVNFKKKISEMKSIKDFDSWTAKERKAAIKYLPKENWVRDLNLKELAKEREESIDLDIDTEEYSRTVYDENGKPKTYKDADGIEHNVTETAFRLRYSDELGQLVKDAVGADMFDRIVNRPFSEWTTEELEQLAQRIDELYTEGRDLLAAKNEAKKREAEAIRKRVEDAIKETGIVINDDDTPEEKERKQKEINKILNLNSGLKGTEAGKDKSIKAKLDRLIHGYSDMNVLRFARMLDNQSEGENVYMLYRKEDECYNAKTRSINSRARAINEIMKANNITEGDLAKSIAVPSLNTEFTVDELLYFLAADKDYAEDEAKLARGLFGLDANDDWAATSRNAVMFGNMMSDTLSQEQKETWDQMDKQMQDAIKNDTLTSEQKQLKALGQLDEHPGTSAYINTCHARWLEALAAANNFLAEHPEYTALMEAIEADYAAQYERMNEVSINEFNQPVHRVRAYVPLVRREQNGDTNVNQVKEDLLATFGSDAGKQWVNKGMTQRRQNISPLHQKPVQTGLFATWGSSVDRTEHFIAYAPYVRQLNAIYKSRDASYTRRFIESRYGKNAVKYLDDYINEVANPNAGKVREAGAEWLHTFRGRTAPAYLGWKFSAIIKQGLTSPWPYMQFVNPAEYASAALECTRKGTYDAIKEKSVFMNNRVMDPMNELIEEMAEEGKTKFDRALGKFGKKGMAGLEWIDWVCVAPGWLACYKKEYARLQRASEARYDAKMQELRERNMYADVGTSEYMTPEQMEAQARQEILEDIETEAVRYADDCTRQCQPSSRAADLAPLFKNSSEAMKAFLQFQTSLNVIWQNIRYDMPYAVRNKQFNRIVGTILGYVFAGIFMNSVMEGVTSGADDDDDKELQALRNLIFYSTTQFTDAIPMIGSEVTNTMDQIITGKRGFMNSGTDMTPSATKMLSVFSNAAKGNWEKAAELSAEAIGMAAGAPVSGTKEIYKLLGKPLSEGDVNFKRGISDVYGVAGDILEE